MRIAIADLVFHWPPRGGSWFDVQGTAAALAAGGDEVRIFAPLFTDYFPRGVVSADPGVAVETIPFTRWSFNALEVPRRFRLRLERFTPDVVLVADGYFLKPHLINGLAARFPVVVRFYAYEVFCWRNTLFSSLTDDNCDTTCLNDKARCYACCPHFALPRVVKRLLTGENLHFQHEFYAAGALFPGYAQVVKEALRRARHHIVYNQHAADLVRQYNPAVSVLPTGVMLPDSVVPCPTDGVFTVFFPGRTADPVKGFDVLRAAVRRLREQGRAVRVWYTSENGGAPDGDPAFVNLGWLDGTSLQPYYAGCDVVVNCSYWREAFGITVVEAMAHGKPVIASRIGGMCGTVIDGLTGLHVAPRDPVDLAEKIARLMDEPRLRQRLGAAALQTVRQQYAWPVIAARTSTILRQAAQSGC